MLSLVESLGNESLAEVTSKMAQAATVSRKDLLRDVLARKTAELRERQVWKLFNRFLESCPGLLVCCVHCLFC